MWGITSWAWSKSGGSRVGRDPVPWFVTNYSDFEASYLMNQNELEAEKDTFFGSYTCSRHVQSMIGF